MRYSNLSNNMVISKLWTTITIQIQYVDGWAAYMTDTTLHKSWQSSPPTGSIAGSIPVLFTWRWISFGGLKTWFFVNFQVTIQIFRWLSKIWVSWMAGWLIPCSRIILSVTSNIIQQQYKLYNFAWFIIIEYKHFLVRTFDQLAQ
jgi:hypothetical protein